MASIFRQRWKKNGVTRLSAKWYVQYCDESGKSRRVPGYPDKRATEQLASRLVREAAQRAEGLLGPADGRAKLPLVGHTEEYAKFLRGKGDCAEHVERTASRVLAVTKGCSWSVIPDIMATQVVEFLADLRADRPVAPLPAGQESFTPAAAAVILGLRRDSVLRTMRRAKLAYEGSGRAMRIGRAALRSYQTHQARGIGAVTSNHYLTAIKGFTRWLCRTGVTVNDPLAFLSALNVEADLRHQRRVLPEEQFKQLLAAARRGSPFRGLAGEDRAALYTLAANSGLRASELGSLTPESFRLTGTDPMVFVAAAYSKHRREDVLPLRNDVGRFMWGYLHHREPGLPVWPGSWTVTAAEMLRRDLDAAGIPYEEGGEVFDFHALRHQFITAVVRATANPKEAQTLARHSTITLTYDHYAHVQRREAAAVLERMPSVG